MRIAIVSKSDEVHSTQRLRDVARGRGHDVDVLSILTGVLVLDGAGIALLDGDRELPRPDVVIPRIGAHFPVHALALLRALEGLGVPSLNCAAAIETSLDKMRTLTRLAASGIPVPPTVLVKDLDRLSWAVEHVGGSPVVVKPLAGSQGRRVIRAETLDGAISVAEALLLLHQDILIQKFISESLGVDLRVLVLGGRVVAAGRREAPPGRFRANMHQGGRLTAIDAAGEIVELSVAAASVCGLDFAGVDILESDGGPLVIEVNGSPGLGGIEAATGHDIAAEILGELEAREQQTSEPKASGEKASGQKAWKQKTRGPVKREGTT